MFLIFFIKSSFFQVKAVHRTLTLFKLFSLQMKEAIMNQEKLAKLQAQVRIGGKVNITKSLK